MSAKRKAPLPPGIHPTIAARIVACIQKNPDLDRSLVAKRFNVEVGKLREIELAEKHRQQPKRRAAK